MLTLIILALTLYLTLSFFGQSAFPKIPHSGAFIYMLSVLVVVLIIMKFLPYL
jgi:hypothetical protein